MATESSRPRILAPPVVLAALCLALGVAGDRLRPIPLFPDSFILRVSGSVALFALFGVILWLAIRDFRRHATTVNPYGTPTALVTTGLFGRSRNPIYVGLLLAMIGFAVALNSLWLLAATVLLFFLLHFTVIRQEERLLASRFGSSYHAYASRVRRWI